MRGLHTDSELRAIAWPNKDATRDSVSSVLDLKSQQLVEGKVDPAMPAWRIHGNVYDLTPFLERHPGGPEVLRSVKGTDDLTAIFESSHAFADRRRVEATMRKYRVGECEASTLAFPDDGFYRVVTERVRAKLLGPHGRGPHATAWWWVKALLLTLAWVASVGFAFFGDVLGDASYSSPWPSSLSPPSWMASAAAAAQAALPDATLAVRCAVAVLAGHLYICVGFVVMHDASHSAVSSSHAINGTLSWAWNAVACWDHRLWHKHHVFRHHSFTGDTLRDPDTIHLTPFLKKHPSSGKAAVGFGRAAPRLATVLFVNLFPGMYLGQAVSYLRWWLRGRLWKMDLVLTRRLDVAACALRGLVLATWLRSPVVAAAYLLAMNCTYAICILPDHDTVETRDAAMTKSTDWGEEQVRNSANFATRNPLVCGLYGGINFQIEHHLFPTLSHVHYAAVQPVVREACREFGIPYVDHPSISSAYGSALRAIATATLA